MDAAVETRKPLILVIEEEKRHGGLPLKQSLHECPERLRDLIFGPPMARRTDTIRWMRLPAFQLESLRLISWQMLAAHPVARGQEMLDLTQVRVTGELREAKLTFPKAGHRIFFHDANVGARAAADELAKT
eukprot:254939-Prymnesium_polylepis.1